MKKITLKAVKDKLTREELKSIMGGSGGESCTVGTCSGGQTRYICHDVMCVGARREVCSFGRPSGYSNCSPG